MKKTGITVLVLVVIGIACCAAAWQMGVDKKWLHLGDAIDRAEDIWENEEFPETDDSSFPRRQNRGETSGGEMEDAKLTVEGEIRHLDLDVDQAEVTVSVGDAWYLEADQVVEWKQEDAVLHISSDNDGLLLGNRQHTVHLTVPQTEFDTLIFDLDAGKINVDGLTAKNRLECSLDAGAINLQNMSASNAEFECDAGSISYNGILTGICSADCDAGSIDLILNEGSTIGKISGQTNAGNISVTKNGQTIGSAKGFSDEFITDTGLAGSDTLRAECDAGKIRIELMTSEAMTNTSNVVQMNTVRRAGICTGECAGVCTGECMRQENGGVCYGEKAVSNRRGQNAVRCVRGTCGVS